MTLINLVFLYKNPKNTPVVDSATGEHLFHFSTPRYIPATTTLWDAECNVVGKYTTNTTYNQVTFNGRTMGFAEWLVERSGSRGQTFVAQNGRSYVWIWEEGGSGYKLVDCLTDELVARGRRRHTGFLSPSRKMNIDVFAGGIPVLGAIVLSFVLCQRSRSGEYSHDSYGSWAAADSRRFQTTQMAFLNSSMVASQPSAMAENIPLAAPVVNVPPVAIASPENIPPAATAVDPEAPVYAHRFSSTTVGYGDDEDPPPYCP